MGQVSKFAGALSLDLVLNELIANAGAKSGINQFKFRVNLDLLNGTLDGQIDRVYAKSEDAIAASATTSYDLLGTLKDLSGNNILFAEVCLIAIRNKRSTALATLIIGPHATNGFGKLVAGRGFWGATADVSNGSGNVIQPNTAAGGDGWVILYAPDGVPVANGASDILAVVASAVAGDVNAYDIVIAGRSAA